MTRADQLASGKVPELFLVQLDFLSGTRRLTSWSHHVDFMGHTWLALQALTSISVITQSERLEFPSVDLGMSVADPSLLALAAGNPQEYRNRPATIWHVVLDDELRPVYDPEVVWAGVMDQLRLKTGDGQTEEASAVMRCEIPGRDGRGAQSLRLNNAQHLARHPGDTGLSRLEGLIGKPVPWLSAKFQRV